MPNYKIVCNEKQLAVISAACELHARLAMGQFHTILYSALARIDIPSDRYVAIRDLLDDAGRKVWGCHGGHPGISNREIPDDSRTAWDIYAVARRMLAFQNRPEGGYGTHFDKPLQVSDQPLPEVSTTDDAPDPRPIKERMRDELVELIGCPPDDFGAALARIMAWKEAWNREQRGGAR